MRAVSVTIVRTVAVVDSVIAAVRASAKFRVRDANARINDIRVHARARDVIVICTVERQAALVKTVQSPRRAALRGFVHARVFGFNRRVGERDAFVLFNKLDQRIFAQLAQRFFIQLRRETFQRGTIFVDHRAAEIANDALG